MADGGASNSLRTQAAPMPAQLGREWISIRDSFIVSPRVTAVSFQRYTLTPRQALPAMR